MVDAVRRGNRRSGIDTLMNLFRILFLLRVARPREIPGIRGRHQALTVPEIRSRLLQEQPDLAANTVRRWLNQMESEHFHVERIETGGDERPRVVFWTLHRNSPLHELRFNEVDAMATYVTYDQLLPMVPPTLRGMLAERREAAERWLSGMWRFEKGAAKWPVQRLSILRSGWIERPPTIDADVLEAIYDALRGCRTLLVDYHSLHAKLEGLPSEQFETSPLRVVQHSDGRLYLLVPRGPELHHDPDSVNNFHSLAVHRIISAHVGDARATVDPEADADAARMTGFGNRGPILLVADIGPPLATRLRESPINETQKISPSGRSDLSWRLEVRLDLTWELEWWLLSNSPDVEVLEPYRVRATLRDRLALAAGRYARSH